MDGGAAVPRARAEAVAALDPFQERMQQARVSFLMHTVTDRLFPALVREVMFVSVRRND